LLLIIKNIHVKKPARLRKGNIGKYAEGGNIIIRIDGGSTVDPRWIHRGSTVLLSSGISTACLCQYRAQGKMSTSSPLSLRILSNYHLHQNIFRIFMLRCFGTPTAMSIALTCRRNVSLGVLTLSLRSS
jgi:hypothetical protein